jgi:predicted amidophosphoribosyltransferase
VALFRDFMYPPITLGRFQALRAKEPKRICFGSIHKNALKDNLSGKAAGFFNVPFIESVGELFPWSLFENTKGNYGGYYRTVTDDDEFNGIKSWISENSDVVFIRSLFDTAVAACEHYIGERRSEVGQLEYRAKYEGSVVSRNALIEVLVDIYMRMHAKRGIDGIVSVPPSTVGSKSLPNYLAAALAAKIGLPDLTSQVSWKGTKGSIKALAVDEKWAALEKVGLNVGDDSAGKDLLLIDDMYQSGATAHFIASQLRTAGSNALHLLAVSKGRRDTDNK